MKNQNLKVGDNLLCKYNIININKNFKIDKYYAMISIYIISNTISGVDFYYYYLFDDDDNLILFCGEEDLYEYFYTKQEERKRKLDKIENYE